MEFTIKTGAPEKLKTGCLVVGAFAGGTLTDAAAALDKASKGKLAALVARGDLDEKAGALLALHELPGCAAERVLVVSLGKQDELADRAWRDAVGAVARALAASPAHDAAVCLADVAPPGRDLEWALQQLARILADGTYRYDVTKSKKKDDKPRGARKVVLATRSKISAAMEAAITRGHAIADGMALAKDLGNLPGNFCTPTHLAETAVELGKQFKLKVEVLERDDMEKLGMGSLLSVARGSHQPPKFIVLHYKGGKAKDKPVVLVGKGITFDTGGISLKPGAEMDEMKFDMCGAASVLGTFKALARMALPINVVGIVPTTENMPGGGATKPGDVVTSMSGQTIEILNTDAEGRLILCDALTYAERFKPACVVDIATLTGACVVALGKIPSGLLANDDELARELTDCGTVSGDRVWQLPLWDEYQELLKSNFADMANIGGRYGGTITAACFLARFTKAYKWAHLDIAGTAWLSGDAKGATGRPVPLLAEFLIARSQDAKA
ncbi:leucyl aminopeptidase [Aromatoleum petrolei]|uniref:Probable cytosol aminopeptidase n=1 Tax=Aromatoleum petrolei TaxID=76116 RepID=A0ABX1MQX3_9RHOO|nr:leucyl aminopeptidase [Aromatoleum petrolei]NMF89101.1 leucyl aminopeptidase [Aromatoleum petrolei]QTQ38307.1 putative cytosol aminopeptidase [Aromatoleum petrolei]